MTDTPDFEDEFTKPAATAHPEDIATRLMKLPELRFIRENEISLGWLMREVSKVKGGKLELGSVHDVKHMAQGGFKGLFFQLLEAWLGFLPQFMIVLDREHWDAATPRVREALVYHELLHIRHEVDKFGALRFDRDGNPVFGLVGHDVEAFNDEVARYGAWHDGIASFLGHAGG